MVERAVAALIENPQELRISLWLATHTFWGLVRNQEVKTVPIRNSEFLPVLTDEKDMGKTLNAYKLFQRLRKKLVYLKNQ